MFKFFKEKEGDKIGWQNAGSDSKVTKEAGYEQKSWSEAERQPDLHQIGLKLAQLEKSLEQSLLRSPEFHIHIENLTVQSPVLESLAFSLDKLDIKDLSGALNLGNNFGATPSVKSQTGHMNESKRKGNSAKTASANEKTGSENPQKKSNSVDLKDELNNISHNGEIKTIPNQIKDTALRRPEFKIDFK